MIAARMAKIKNLTRGLKAAAKALVAAPPPAPVTIARRALVCPHCEGTRFVTTKVSLNTRGSSFLNVEWLDKEASVMICASCTRMEWFYDPDL
jgi:predicted nucleic-acid-binding Zn-ribbon protein